MLKDFWYLALQSSALRPGRSAPVKIAGEDLLLVRSKDGVARAYIDRCPHRLMPLRHGGFDGETMRCWLHGWGFRASDGQCVDIPALADPGEYDCSKFRLRSVPCREVQGNLWIYPGNPAIEPPAIPVIPGFDGQAPRVVSVLRFPCDLDTAAIGFIDPAHPAFVHTSRWWKRKPGDLRLKNKEFEPDGMGFRMKTHALKHGANPYRLLGRNIQVNLKLELPGTRVEHIQGDKHSAGVLAAATPIDENTTNVWYCIYWSMPWLNWLKPLARYMATDFLRQDQDVAVRLAEAGSTGMPPLFVGGADTQIRWWIRLHRELTASRAEGRDFVNPLRPQTLSWRS